MRESAWFWTQRFGATNTSANSAQSQSRQRWSFDLAGYDSLSGDTADRFHSKLLRGHTVSFWSFKRTRKDWNLIKLFRFWLFVTRQRTNEQMKGKGFVINLSTGWKIKTRKRKDKNSGRFLENLWHIILFRITEHELAVKITKIKTVLIWWS